MKKKRRRVLPAIVKMEAERVARGQCRHCGGPVPCWSPFGDAAVGERHSLQVAPLNEGDA